MTEFKFDTIGNEIIISINHPKLQLSCYEIDRVPDFLPDNALVVFCNIKATGTNKYFAFVLTCEANTGFNRSDVNSLITEAINWFCLKVYNVLPEALDYSWMYKYFFIDLFLEEDFAKHNCKPYFEYSEDERAEKIAMNQHLKDKGLSDDEIIAYAESVDNEMEFVESFTGPHEWLPVVGEKKQVFDDEELPF